MIHVTWYIIQYISALFTLFRPLTKQTKLLLCHRKVPYVTTSLRNSDAHTVFMTLPTHRFLCPPQPNTVHLTVIPSVMFSFDKRKASNASLSKESLTLSAHLFQSMKAFSKKMLHNDIYPYRIFK
ncbi:unnamed protein product [Leptidea sinapis]|uniref:Uncharacterized protein n=1 Tax=Leptidea sinapis TaxID=189913 RepID=A0A5E4PS65_9NEOP|nr:unnamed protein product [Leptidea sinapis]